MKPASRRKPTPIEAFAAEAGDLLERVGPDLPAGDVLVIIRLADEVHDVAALPLAAAARFCLEMGASKLARIILRRPPGRGQRWALLGADNGIALTLAPLGKGAA